LRLWYDLRNMEIDPVTYPTVTLDGKSYEVKFRCGDILRLKKDKDIDLLGGITEQLKGADAMNRTLELLASGLAHTQAGFTAEQLADMVDLAQLKTVAETVTAALLKAVPQPTPGTPGKSPAIQ
jgi:hypothetical protein